MNKKIIPALLVCLIALAVIVYSQNQVDSALINQLNEEEETYYGQELCIDPETGEITVLMDEYTQPLENMTVNPEIVFPIDTQYLQKLSDVVEIRKGLVDSLLGSDGIKQYKDLAAGNPLGDFVNVKVLPVMEGAGDIVRVSTELYRDASGQALSISTAPLFTAYDMKQAAKDGAIMNIFFQGMMAQLESNGELEKAVNYAAGIITQQTQAQNTISTAHSYMDLAKEGAKSSSDMFALAASVGERNPGLAQKITTIGMFQMSQALANTQEAAKLKMLVLFMLLNDIRFNKMRYGALMQAFGPPCDIDPMPPCPGCPMGFYAFQPKGCPEVGPYPPGMPPLPAGGGSPTGLAVVSGCDRSPLTGAAAAGQGSQSANAQAMLPLQVFTEFPLFEFNIEAPEIVPFVAEPDVTNVITNYIKKLSASKAAFVKEKVKDAVVINGELYLGSKHVEIDLRGDVIDSSGNVMESFGPDFGRAYSVFRLAEKRLEQVKTVAEIESKPALTTAEQERYVFEYRNMIRADIRLLDLIYSQELEKIQSSTISNEAKKSKISLLNQKSTDAKIKAIESAVSDNRLMKFMEKVPSREIAIRDLMKKRDLSDTVTLLILQVTNDEELAVYYQELEQNKSPADV